MHDITWKIFYVHFRKLYFVLVYSVLYITVKFNWFITVFQSCISLFIFYLVVLSITESGLLKFTTVTIELFHFSILLIFFYLQFLVCGGPSSSLSRANRAALRDSPRIPSPHSFSALRERGRNSRDRFKIQQVQFQKLKFTLFKSNIHTKQIKTCISYLYDAHY